MPFHPSGLGKVVAHAPLRDDVFGGGGVALELFAQAADVHVHGADIALIVIAPHEVEQLLARIDLAGNILYF